MNDVMEQIKTLSATLDEETTRFHPTGRLRHWNRRFSELYDELRKEIDHE